MQLLKLASSWHVLNGPIAITVGPIYNWKSTDGGVVSRGK